MRFKFYQEELNSVLHILKLKHLQNENNSKKIATKYGDKINVGLCKVGTLLNIKPLIQIQSFDSSDSRTKPRILVETGQFSLIYFKPETKVFLAKSLQQFNPWA